MVTAVGEGRRPETSDRHVQALWAVVDEVQRSGGVSDETFAEAVELFGEPCLIELVVAVGYYTTLAMVMNVARTPPEPGPELPVLERVRP